MTTTSSITICFAYLNLAPNREETFLPLGFSFVEEDTIYDMMFS